MKIGKIAFSGFAAAILMGACGAAEAAVQLASKGYVEAQVRDVNDNMSRKQDKLIAGDGIVIGEDGKTISAAITDDEGNVVNVSKAIEDATSAAAAAQGTADGAAQAAGTAQAAAEAAQGTADNAATAAGTAQAAAEAAQADVDALEGKVGTIAEGSTVSGLIDAAQTAANNAAGAATQAQNEVDALELLVADKAAQADLEALTGRVSTNEAGVAANKAAIDKLNGGAEVEGSVAYQIKDLREDLASSGESAEAVAAQVEQLITDVDQAEADIDALEEKVGTETVAKQIQDATAGMVTETTLSAKGYATESYVDQAESDAVAAAKEYAVAKKSVPAGTFLVTSDGNGGLSWTSIEVTGDDGDPMDLTEDTVPSNTVQ
ncbi:MAG: hypothetical protein IJD52_02335 [Alphaproteobacteria bacterium]|nr:hypothetical protein [Alphaproteobacteria bacterium]